MADLPLLFRALSFAAAHHAEQRRKGANKEPYINHPIQVARLLADVAEVQDVDLLCAALLHDTIEDTVATEETIRATFGDTITEFVLEVTDDKSLPKAERKKLQVAHAATLSHGARLLKLADKISNLQDLVEKPPVGWELARVQGYYDWADAVVQKVRGLSPQLDALYDRIVSTRP